VTDGPGRLLTSFGAATLLHLGLLPLLGFAFGDSDRGGDEKADGVQLELFRSDEPPLPPAAPAALEAAKVAQPLSVASSSTPVPPPPAPASAPRPGQGAPRGRRAPDSATRGSAARLRSVAASPSDAAPAAASPVAAMELAAGAAVGSAPVESSPAAGPPANEAATEDTPGAGDEAQAGCAESADGSLVCGVSQSDVLNRPQTFVGMIVSPGYEERAYEFHREGDDYVYRADSHNAVIVHEDGSVEIESGPRASDALCILGGAPLPWDIPEMPLYQYDELEQATSGIRRDMQARQESRWTDDALDGLRAELTAAVSSRRRSPAASRRFLFQRWDECTEIGAGLDARRIIEELIRQSFPQDGSRGYTAEELSDLNAGRSSRMQFCPYGCP
jgi:hypothetical protein